MIEVHDLAKTYSRRKAVANATFRANDGAITGLLGANGAGKTTTLRMICGALAPDAGRIVLDDESDSREPLARQRRVGALLDHIGLYGRLTARENLAYFGELRGLSGTSLAKRVDEVISLLGMQSIADRRTAGFSQGERMKTALGRAILHSPRNVVLDEPTNGLDVPAVRSLRDLLRRLRDSGVCILLSSHVLAEVRALCDELVILSHGRVVAQGPPDEICDRAAAASLEDAFVKLTTESAPC